MSQQNKWYYEWNDGSYRPYDSNVTQWLNTANTGDSTVLSIGQSKYQMLKLSNTDCTQTNIRSRYERKGITQIKYDQMNNNQNHGNINYKSNNINNNQIMKNNNNYKSKENYEWGWKSDKGRCIKYNNTDSNAIEKLQKNESYFIFANATQYEIVKTSKNKCKQINVRTNKSREVIRQTIKSAHNQQSQMHQQNVNNLSNVNYDNDDMKQGSDIWHFVDNNGAFQCMDIVVSNRIDNLNINETMRHNTMYGEYELKKISNTKGEQKNIQTNNIREIRKMNQFQQKQYNNNPSNKPKKSSDNKPKINRNGDNNDDEFSDNDDEKKKQSVEKWYWQTDDGAYKPMNDELCQRLHNLTIGESMKKKIANGMYEFKKTAIGKGSQRNIRTNKSRDIRVAKYGWFYEDNDKSLKPFTDHLSGQISNCQIGSSFTFSLKSGAKYQVSKTSNNLGKQKNLSTKFERNIVYKMTLNDKNDSGGGRGAWRGSISTAQSGGRDWVKEREKKAMKTGKTVRCKLIQKRNLFEDTADAHFRRCESQFMRSCTNLGLNTNGLNNTIKEVEYIINPKLIKKFEAKKKQLMSKNKWKDESKLNIILAWHGTPNANLNSIVEKNFTLSKLASNSGDTGWYGKGIYFSEYAKISLGYGKGLLLCKVMLGKSHKMLTSQQQTGRSCEKGYDSHTVVSSNGLKYGQEIVIFDVDQILPCYIVKF